MHHEVDTSSEWRSSRPPPRHHRRVVGINLLREGLDLPEVSLVAILDADKEASSAARRA